jgi:hypothetical protein
MEAHGRSAARLVLSGALAVVGCKSETTDGSALAETTQPSVTATPASLRAPPAADRPASAEPTAQSSAAALRPAAQGSSGTESAQAAPKTVGRTGELLTGDVYAFRAISVQPCGGSAHKSVAPQASASAPSHNESVVIGALVEIAAKGRLSISPRDAQLVSGGITFYASVDDKRRLVGCTPLLKRSMIQKDQVAKGYVLFDVPLPEPRTLELMYRPTRWGGATPVRVRIRG